VPVYFCMYPAQMRMGPPPASAQAIAMHNDEHLGLINDVALDVLERIGDDPEARYQFFRRWVELARGTVARGRDGCRSGSAASSAVRVDRDRCDRRCRRS